MKFGVRDICNVVFKAKATTQIGSMTFQANQPVLYIDTAKTSTLEGAATTVYATGGRGNTRLVAWEGEKTLTFTVEDAVLSPISFAILSGAGLIHDEDVTNVNVHTTSIAQVVEGEIDLSGVLTGDETISTDTDAPVYIVAMEDGDFAASPVSGTVDTAGKKITLAETDATALAGKTVFVDYYMKRPAADVAELQIDAENFAGYYYVEADCLFRRTSDGVDLPAQLTLPKVKIQSNFTFTMAATGDPSTFTFTMDAMPDYTYFNKKRKVLCALQVIDDSTPNEKGSAESVFPLD